MSEIQDEAYSELCLENERLKNELREYRQQGVGDLLRLIDDQKVLIRRAADALEDAPIEHALGCPVAGICVCESGKERVLICDELRKAAE